jgi:hypothetical protein
MDGNGDLNNWVWVVETRKEGRESGGERETKRAIV